MQSNGVRRLPAARARGLAGAMLLGSMISVAPPLGAPTAASGQGNGERAAGPRKSGLPPAVTGSLAPLPGPGREASRMTGVSYDPVAFRELPEWEREDHLGALKAFIASCARVVALRRAATEKSGRQRTPPALAAVCEVALGLPPRLSAQEARSFLETNFLPHRVVHKGHEGLLTGYYEPLLEGSRQRTSDFQAPLLRRPRDLVTAIRETEPQPAGSLTHGKRTANGLQPLPSRAEIEAGALAGRNLELLYLPSPVDVFFLQIQGSGRVRLPDGTSVRVHYDGKNGHPYTSIGRYLIEKGIVAADKMTMEALAQWLKANPQQARVVMDQNASYVFFREMPVEGDGPPGALEVPLIAGRSLAIDPGAHALGSPIYVSATELAVGPGGRKQPFHRLMVAHDVGAAIKGPERGDIFFGSGDAAGQIAGMIRQPGNFFVFLARGDNGAGAGR